MEAKPDTYPYAMLVYEHVSALEVAARELIVRRVKVAQWLIVLSVWYASVLIPIVSIGQTVICPKEYIVGFEKEHELATSLLPGNVIGNPKMQIFVMQRGGDIYIQSNYRPSEEFEYPIKIKTKDSRDLKKIHKNIYSCAGQASPDFDVVKAYENDASFIFDESIINERGEIDLEIGSKISDNVYGLFDGRPPPKRLRKIKSSEIPPVWMAEYEPSIFAKLKVGFKPDKVLGELRKLPFHRNDVQLVSLFIDKAVESKLAKSSIKELTAKLQSISEAEIEKVFATSDAKIIVLLGHANEDSFVTKSSDGQKTLLDMSFIKVKALAEKYRKDVIYLGCNSYQAAGLGADRAFNPLLALSHLEKAVNARNFHDFLSTFSSPELGIVMDESAFANSTRKEEVTDETVKENDELITEGGKSAFAFKIVKKSRNGNPKKDSYDIGQEVGTVRFDTGFRGLTTPSTSRQDTVVTPQPNNLSLDPGINLGPDTDLGGGVAGGDKAPNWKLWGVLLAMLALIGFLFSTTLGKKNKS